MSLKGHVQTRATVVRAGETVTLVSIEDWYRGQILAPVDTAIVEAAAGKLRQHLPDTQLWVMARLTAQSAEDLDLQQWKTCQGVDSRAA
ncbi:hypothetical protein [Streptomyces sp. NPDC003996]